MVDRPRVLSVNLATERVVQFGGREVRTGIYKEPAAGRVRLRALGLAGDFQADPSVHGGPDKAAYVYPSEHYSYFRELLGRADLSPGFFEENLTTEGLLEEGVRVGDVFRVGTAVVRVTTPRTPGFKLSGVEEGEVGAGDTIRRIGTDPRGPTLARFIEERYFRAK